MTESAPSICTALSKMAFPPTDSKEFRKTESATESVDPMSTTPSRLDVPELYSAVSKDKESASNSAAYTLATDKSVAVIQ